MNIFHIIGTSCAGKTVLIDRIKKIFPENIFVWDVLDFYEKHEVIANGIMDWTRFYQYIPLLSVDLDNFINEHKNEIVIVESSGGNKKINSLFEKYKVDVISLRTPPEEVLVQRAEIRKLDINKTIKFAIDYENRVEKQNLLSEEDAYQYLYNAVIKILTNR